MNVLVSVLLNKYRDIPENRTLTGLKIDTCMLPQNPLTLYYDQQLPPSINHPLG